MATETVPPTVAPSLGLLNAAESGEGAVVLLTVTVRVAVAVWPPASATVSSSVWLPLA
jgi:hypothetical protein